jgi:hypothetical protein
MIPWHFPRKKGVTIENYTAENYQKKSNFLENYMGTRIPRHISRNKRVTAKR